MTADLRALFRSGVVALVGLGVGAVFLILGVAAVALQSQCASGAISFGVCPQAVAAVPPAETGSTEPELPATELAAAAAPDAAQPEPSVTDVADTASPAELIGPSPRDVALETAGGLIAGTFDALVFEDAASDDAAPSETEVTAVAEVESAVAEASGARENEATPPLALAKRTVTSVPVGSDGQPLWTALADPESSSAAAGAARDVASAAGTPEVEPLAFAPLPEANPPQPLPKPEVLIPEASPSTSGAVTTRSAVNVRSGPSGSHKRLFVLAAGAEVEATHADKGWVRIVDGDGRDGWAYSDYLANVDLDALPAPEAGDVQVAVAAEAPAASGDIRTVKGQGVNVRSGPSSSSGKLFALRGGTKVTVSDENRGWLKVTDPDGRTGWAYQQFLSGG